MKQTGTLIRDSGAFGFIKQDSGDDDMFLMPQSCGIFGGRLPTLGTRVLYNVVIDEKTGRPRADEVEPEDGVQALPPMATPATAAAFAGGSVSAHSGSFAYAKGNYGFIKQDSGEPDMFVMPAACQGFGGCFPGPGTRVVYDVVADVKTGRPRAEGVYPESHGIAAHGPGMQLQGFGWQHPGAGMSVGSRGPVAWRQPVAPHAPQSQTVPAWPLGGGPGSGVGTCSGTMDRSHGNYGFIKQDSGEADMFVMPAACAAFSSSLPAQGARLLYEVVTDPKTGRPRADNVRPDDVGADFYGKAVYMNPSSARARPYA